MRILGLDGGVASVGWAIVDIIEAGNEGRIVKCGSYAFHPPEEGAGSKRKLKNVVRRQARGQRRVVLRRRRRMAHIRRLFCAHGLLTQSNLNALAGHGLNPVALRAAALDRVLEPLEFAVALSHIAKHRGFHSNKKGDGSKKNKQDDTRKMLAALDATRGKLSKYRTFGEMLAHDPNFAERTRNREGDYSRTALREDLQHEVHCIFAAQQRLGNEFASDKLLQTYKETAFFQRPVQSSADMVGACSLVQTEKRASSYCPSFERFRFLSKLVTTKIVCGQNIRLLTPDEISLANARFGLTQTYTWNTLRKAIGLADDEHFYRISLDKEKKQDVARSAGAARGTRALFNVLRPVLGDLDMKALFSKAEPLDAIVGVIAFNEDMDKICADLGTLDLPQGSVEALMDAARSGVFDFVKGTGHISAKAARRLIPHLEQGLRYDEACANEGWDHAAERAWKLDDITSPVARKAAREMMKQIKVLEHGYGPFDHIHVEMARDIGKSIEERGRLERGLKDRTKQREKAIAEFKDRFNVEHVSDDDILRYELWKQQSGRCLYSNQGIEAALLVSRQNLLQVDHILPFSRFGDNSFQNKTLCFTSANQNKRNRTPFEWISLEKPDDWDRFAIEVESNKSLKGIKKRNYLLMDGHEREEAWRARNLNDTRYALRVVLALLRHDYPDIADGTDEHGKSIMRRRVFARPGAITSALRKAWGLESLKKDPETGERLRDDRHHALDAIITACCSEALLQRATRHAQAQEKRGEKFELRHLPTPWGDAQSFRRDVSQKIEEVFVCRPERGRIRGQGHKDTISRIREKDGQQRLQMRVSVEDLTLEDLDRIPVPEPYGQGKGRIGDPKKLRDQMVDSLRAWIIQRDDLAEKVKKATKNSDEHARLKAEQARLEPPRSPKGDAIRKVRLWTKDKKPPAIRLSGGSVDREGMVRVDVFSKPSKAGKDEFYLVPIYRCDIYTHDEQLKTSPPNKAIVAGQLEDEWVIVDRTFKFLFSLYTDSLIEIETARGEKKFGYYRGVDRSTAAISVSAVQNTTEKKTGIGVKTLKLFRKFRVDRLGTYKEIKSETRTWRGKACT